MTAPTLSKAAQRQRLLDWLKHEGCIATSEAREYLNVMHPAARICELRNCGYDIVTVWQRIADSAGVVHRQATYAIREGVTP